MKFFKNKTGIVFLLVICYIFAAFVWWVYLLNQKVGKEFELKTEIEKLHYSQGETSEKQEAEFLESQTYEELVNERDRQRWMILGEGAVFLILLFAGALKIKSSFQKELSLARQKNNFLLSITHELKSPLASIRLSIETLLRRLTAEEKFKRIMRNSLHDVDRLSNLVDNILLAARMENNSYPFQMELLNISNIAKEAVDSVAESLGENHELKIDINQNIECHSDKMAIHAVLVNLLENAVKYSPAGTLVKLSLSEKNKHIIIEISDNGMGIPNEEKSEIFKKFYRIGNEDTRKTKGTGLGLYIVKNIVEQLKGKIEVEDNPEGGSIFRILLQKNQNNG